MTASCTSAVQPWPPRLTRRFSLTRPIPALSRSLSWAGPETRARGVDHHAHQLREGDAGPPAQLLPSARGVAAGRVTVERPLVAGIALHVVAIVQAHPAEREVAQLPDRVRLAGGKHVVVGFRGLEPAPEPLDEVSGVPPVSTRLEVPQGEAALPARG